MKGVRVRTGDDSDWAQTPYRLRWPDGGKRDEGIVSRGERRGVIFTKIYSIGLCPRGMDFFIRYYIKQISAIAKKFNVESITINTKKKLVSIIIIS